MTKEELEQRIINLEAKFMGQIAGLKGDVKDKNLLVNDRITEAFFIIEEMAKKCDCCRYSLKKQYS